MKQLIYSLHSTHDWRLPVARLLRVTAVEVFSRHDQSNLQIYSSKHSANHKEMQAALNCAEIKLKQTFHTRWLSFDGVVDAILINIDPLIFALISDSDSDSSAKGLLQFMTNFLFVATTLATTHFFCDILPLLSQLSKCVQQKQVDFKVISHGVSTTVAALQSLKLTLGPRLRRFLSEIPDIPQDAFYFMNVMILPRVGKLLSTHWWTTTFSLRGLSSFSILDPQKLPLESYLGSHGITELELYALQKLVKVAEVCPLL